MLTKHERIYIVLNYHILQSVINVQLAHDDSFESQCPRATYSGGRFLKFVFVKSVQPEQCSTLKKIKILPLFPS